MVSAIALTMSLKAVRARLVERAQDWRWSRSRAHLRWTRMMEVPRWHPSRSASLNFSDLLASDPEPDLFARLRAAARFGRPPGDDGFLAAIERPTRRPFKPSKRGPKPAAPEGH